MFRLSKTLTLLFIMIIGVQLHGQQSQKKAKKNYESQEATYYIIERDLPGAENLTKQQLEEIKNHSKGVIKEIGDGIEWIESYITPGKIYCKYRADHSDLLKEHAAKGGFPLTKISKIHGIIDPKA